MKKVIFNNKEVKRDWPASSLAPVLYWVSVDEPKFRYTTIMGALKWGKEIYGTRKFVVDIEEGTISIKPSVPTSAICLVPLCCVCWKL